MKNSKILILLFINLLFTVQINAQTNESSKYDWKKVVVGGGGYVTGIVFSEAQHNIIYSRTDVGGAYRWDSVSSSWIQLLDFVSRDSADMRCVESIAADPNDPNRVYIAAGANTGSSIGGIFCSSNQGKTLTCINTPFKMAANNDGRGKGERMVVDPNSSNILLYGSRTKGLYRSIDSAKHWSKIATFPITSTSDGEGLCFVIFDKKSSTPGNPTNDIYVGVSQNGSSLYKSSDAGATWSVITGSPTNLQPHNAALDSSGIMYITYCNAVGPGNISSGSVWRYNTKKQIWTQIIPTSEAYGGYGGISVDKHIPGIIMVASTGRYPDVLYRIKDNGATFTWKKITSSNVKQIATDAPYQIIQGQAIGNWIESLKIDPFNSDRVIYGTGSGIWASDDVTKCDSNIITHWNCIVKGIEEGGAYHITSPPSGAMLFTQFGDINGFRHEDISVVPSGLLSPGWGYGHCIDFAQNNPNIMVRVYANSPYGYNSTDNGKTWKSFVRSIPHAGTNREKITISADGNNIVWIPEGFAPYYSKDHGQNWSPCRGLPAAYNNSIKSDRVNDNKIYCLSRSSGYLYISVDGGANYTKAGLTAGTANDVRLETNPKTEGDLWVPIYGQSAGANGLYHSINSGTTFTKIPNVQQATSVSLGREEPGKQYPTIYFYGLINNKWGVYQSTDTAKTWVKINDSQHQYGWIDFVVADERTFGRVYLSPNCMGVPYSQLKYDCHGDSAGTAYSDWCGECVGGKTGKISTCLDCKGDTNGTAFKDSCGRCVGGNTGLYPCSRHDCVGVLNGTAHFDSCGICVGGNTGKISCNVDCNKVPEGTAYKDSCNICVGGNTGKKPCITSVSNTVNDIFEFYPNPFTKGMFLNSKIPCNYTIEDLSGIFVESGHCENNCIVGENLKTGFYLMIIRNKKEIKTIKVVKQ